MRRLLNNALFLLVAFVFICSCNQSNSNKTGITKNLSIIRGDCNGAVITSGKHRLVVYGDPMNTLTKADMVLFTHARRDVVWEGKTLVNEGAKAVVPKNELDYFIHPDSVWNKIANSQFHDYRQKTSRVPTEPLAVAKSVEGGDSFLWQNIPIKVIDSRGYTEGAVSYLVHVDDIDVAFVGDLIYGDGKIMDIYSMQDKIPELDMWGYHGFAARMADIIKSLERIKELKPDIIIPARGPVINNPEDAINKLISRLRLVYKNYLSINSFRWYRSSGWGKPEDGTVNLASRVLPSGMTVNWMPFAKTGKNPSWLINVENSKLIVAADGKGFLIDCGIDKAYNKLINLKENFRCTNIENIFISHYHDDHTDFINKIREKYKCPAIITKELKDILNHPQAYKMPAMTSEPITNLTVVPEGSTMNWKEFTFTFYYFPGQTIYHDAMLVKNRNTGEELFITGDSFSPTGIDDYCLQNRNLLGENLGYLYCIDVLKNLPDSCWLTNQHIAQPFRFSKKQLNFMTDNLIERQALLKDLFVWDNINYGIDEQWARFYPYSQIVENGQTSTEFSIIIYNHSAKEQEFTIHPETGKMICSPDKMVISIPTGKERKINFNLNLPTNLQKGNKIITVDISFDKWNLHKWCESIIKIK